MDDEKTIIGWLLSQINTLEIQVERLSYLNDMLPGYFDVVVHAQHEDRKLSGWGFGENEAIALTKAIAEVIERISLFEGKFENSNGIAAHKNFVHAASSAKRELLERDLLLCHFFSKTPFEIADHSSYGLESVQQWYLKHRVDFSLFRLGPDGFLALLDGRKAIRPFGFKIGVAVKDSLKASAISAAIEASRTGYKIVNSPKIDSISLSEFRKHNSYSFYDHGRLALDLSYAQQISFLFEAAQQKVPETNFAPAVSVQDLDLKHPKLKDCPLKFARATSPDVQQLFLGDFDPQKINLRRLSQFAGRELSYDDLLQLPHPLN
jgi:hypothetical protein